jgi:hypothetical protein
MKKTIEVISFLYFRQLSETDFKIQGIQFKILYSPNATHMWFTMKTVPLCGDQSNPRELKHQIPDNTVLPTATSLLSLCAKLPHEQTATPKSFPASI